jgi:hypothetical protein
MTGFMPLEDDEDIAIASHNPDYPEILRLAAICNQPDEYFTPENMAAYEAGLGSLAKYDCGLMLAASKLLAGKRFRVNSDSPEFVAMYRTLAKHMGASVNSEESSGPGGIQIVLTPAPKQ